MSNDYCIVLPTADIPLPEDFPPQTVLINDWVDGIAKTAYQYTIEGTDPTPDWPVSAEVYGGWDSDTGLQTGESYDTDGTTVIGTPLWPINPDFWVHVNVLGNRAGEATPPLRIIKWQGHSEEKYAVEDTSEYPPSNAPYNLELFREDKGGGAVPYTTDDAYPTGSFVTHSGSTWEATQDVPAAPAWDIGTTYSIDDYVEENTSTYRSLENGNVGNNPLFGAPWVLDNITPFGGSPYWTLVSDPGWYWVVVVNALDPGRVITARAIGIYSAPGADPGDFLYTTGAFVQDGSYGNRFYTKTPPGQQTATPDQINFALLLGSAPEGWWVLPAGEFLTDAFFWAADA